LYTDQPAGLINYEQQQITKKTFLSIMETFRKYDSEQCNFVVFDLSAFNIIDELQSLNIYPV